MAKNGDYSIQSPYHLWSQLDQGKQSFYNARIALQYTSISCKTYRANNLIEHTFISCQFNKQVYCFLYFQASEEKENNIKVINIKAQAGPVQFTPLDAKQRQATCKLVNLKNQKPGQELRKYVNVSRVCMKTTSTLTGPQAHTEDTGGWKQLFI